MYSKNANHKCVIAKVNNWKFLIALTCAITICTGALNAQNVINDWNTIASATIIQNGGKPSGAGSVWFAYAAIASYDAVNAINHGFQPFYYNGKAPSGASPEAAAVAAAHRVLVNYFPTPQTTLDTEFTTSIAAIQATDDAKAAGIAVGEASAQTLIAERIGDGLEADIPYTPGTGPGVWQPTPPAFAAAATPWLGQMRPFTMSSSGQFLPPGPTPLDRTEW